MKKTAVYLAIIVAASVITYGFQQLPPKEKQYHLSYTAQEWSLKVQAIDNVKEIMRKSTYPGATISQWQDSLTSLVNDINSQIGAQMRADTVKPKK